MLRYGSAVIAEPSTTPEAWTKTVCCGHKGSCTCGGKSCRVKVARTVLAKYDPQKYLLSHCSIMAAVDTEQANPKDPKSDFYIHPAYSKFVNNNGDAWSKKMLAASYKTFVGSNNYQEHVQIPELSKGKVVDAVLREVPIGKDKEGKDLTTYYVDILVATDRKHRDLVAKIESGNLSTLSMGCKISFSICTKCGNKAVDETQACQHVKYEKNNMFYDDGGVQRKVAELCGHYEEPDSVVFVDASWVANPAFTGAVIRNIVNPPENIMAKIQEAEKKDAYEYKDGDLLKAAHIKKAQAPVIEEGGPGGEPSAEGAPPEEAPAEGAPPEEAPVEGAPAEEAPAEEAPPEESEVKKWKTQIKQQILKQLGEEISKEFSEEEETGARELETLDESLIQPTASTALKQMWKMKKSWDKYLQKKAGGFEKKHFDKLKFGSYMLLNSSDMSVLKDYGYSRRDFLAVMSFIDDCFKKPLDKNIKRAVAELDGTQNRKVKELIFALQKIAGRKLSVDEINKSLTWLKLMDQYQE